MLSSTSDPTHASRQRWLSEMDLPLRSAKPTNSLSPDVINSERNGIIGDKDDSCGSR